MLQFVVYYGDIVLNRVMAHSRMMTSISIICALVHTCCLHFNKSRQGEVTTESSFYEKQDVILIRVHSILSVSSTVVLKLY